MPDVFQTLAEFAIGLAGFAAIVVAIARRTNAQIYLARLVIINALAPGMWVLFPAVLQDFNVQGDMLWQATSAFIPATLLTIGSILLRRSAQGETHGVNHWLHMVRGSRRSW